MTLLEIVVFILALVSMPFLFVLLSVSSIWMFNAFTNLLLKQNIETLKQLVIWLTISAILSVLFTIDISIIRLYLDPIIGQIYIFILTH
jgi:hypothetical protein